MSEKKIIDDMSEKKQDQEEYGQFLSRLDSSLIHCLTGWHLLLWQVHFRCHLHCLLFLSLQSQFSTRGTWSLVNGSINISVDFYFWAQKSNFTFIVRLLFDGHLLLRLSSITCVISTLTWALLTSPVPIQQKFLGLTSRIENFTCQEYLSRVEGRWWESKPPQTGWPTVPT